MKKEEIRCVLVAGAGKSGLGACELLQKRGIKAVLYDSNEKAEAAQILAHFAEETRPRLILGELTREEVAHYDLCVISPGIPLTAPFVCVLKEAGVPIWSEIELAYVFGNGRVAAITGTNGKTTTTALTGDMLALAFPEHYVVGNIGIPYTQEAPCMSEAAVTVAEVSSFQLETIHSFHPQVSAILNVTPDHLNRHGSVEEYARIKERITENQSSDEICVLNYEDELLREFGEKAACHIFWFSSRRELAEGIFLRGEEIIWREGGEEVSLLTVQELSIVGTHNYENAMAAIAVARHMGVDFALICEALRSFRAVEHRLEYVTEREGVVYYNDSKGTNPDAAIKGICAMTRPTHLIAGGYDKHSDYEEWLRACLNRVKTLVLIGQTAERIAACAREVGLTEIVLAPGLAEAVSCCREKAQPGDAVLLSPACASWGMFDNYEQRGRIFKELCREEKL